MPVLGITGGIATGKSLFTSLLAPLLPGVEVFDSDRCAHELTASDPAILTAIRDEFGPGVFDASGTLQRPVLRDIVFADTARRRTLEGILHPAIRRSWMELARKVRERSAPCWLAVDIPLLFETAAEKEFDKIVVVACSAGTQRSRLKDRRQLPPDLAESMIASQLPLAVKIERADFVIWNDGRPEAMESQVRLLACELSSLLK